MTPKYKRMISKVDGKEYLVFNNEYDVDDYDPDNIYARYCFGGYCNALLAEDIEE